MATYIALMRKNQDSDFSVDFPNFPGCVTAESTVDKAVRVNVTLPRSVLARIDAVTDNRSAFLTRAAIREMEKHGA